MKKFLPLILGLAAVSLANGEGIDLQNRMILNQRKLQKSGFIKSIHNNDLLNKGRLTRGAEDSGNTDDDYIRAFVRIAEGFSADDLSGAGMEVLSVKGEVAIVSLPIDKVEEFSNLECVKKLSLEKKLEAKMNNARAISGVDDIHEGKNLKLPYTGKGTFAAIVDQGVDPNHVAFIDEEGNNRVKYLTYFDGTAGKDGSPNCYYYGEEIYDLDENGKPYFYPTIDQFNTDLQSTYHGTHTLNILGGGYSGNVKMYENGSLIEKTNPYYGVAKEAALGVSCGDLSDACVALGVAEMIGFGEAYSVNNEKPGMQPVVSMSLGSTAGPHDPNSLMNYYLNYCGNEAIIVVSSGNEGDLKIALNKTFTKDDNTIQSFVYPYGFRYDSSKPASTSNTYIRQGTVMVYSNDNTPFTVKAKIYVNRNGSFRPLVSLSMDGENGTYFGSDTEWADYVQGTYNNTLGRYFYGYVGGGSMPDKDLGRYYGGLDYYLITNPETGIDENGEELVLLGFEITGVDGQRIDCFCDGANTWISNYGMEGFDDGSRDGTISDMAVGGNILVVGAYNSRDKWVNLDGRTYTYDMEGMEAGAIGPYTSYGTLPDGSTLPHVCAPGTAVMSAISSKYVDFAYTGSNAGYLPMDMSAKATLNGKDYYWKPETGTSMSTPFVAGSIALWLEADPTLDINKVIDIINKTSVKDSHVAAGIPAQWGAGKFNALAGIKEVINNAAVESIDIDNRNDRLILSEVGDGIFNVFVGSARNLNVNVFSLSGNKVFGSNVAGNETTVDLSNLAKGVYILKANNHAEKLYIK